MSFFLRKGVLSYRRKRSNTTLTVAHDRVTESTVSSRQHNGKPTTITSRLSTLIHYSVRVIVPFSRKLTCRCVQISEVTFLCIKQLLFRTCIFALPYCHYSARLSARGFCLSPIRYSSLRLSTDL